MLRCGADQVTELLEGLSTAPAHALGYRPGMDPHYRRDDLGRHAVGNYSYLLTRRIEQAEESWTSIRMRFDARGASRLTESVIERVYEHLR